MPEKRTIPRTCQVCGIGFLAKPSIVRLGQGLTCGRQCGGKLHSNRVDLTCRQCGSAFTAPASQTRKGGGSFCSRACYFASKPRQPKPSPYTQARICAYCERAFLAIPWGDVRCCSKSCARRLANGTPEQRFWAQVEKTDGCWFWIPAKARNEYGAIRVLGHRSKVKAHRFSWELHFGPIPDGLDTLHHCDTPPCVRPDHLFLGTNGDNVADKVSKGRQSKGAGTGVAKLTPDTVRAIRAMLATGAGQRETARAFDVSHTTVRWIAVGKIWKHVN